MAITRRDMLARAAGGLAASAMPAWASEEKFPSRPVRIVVPFSAGGSADVTARILAERLQALWGQPVVIENKAGAGTTVGSTFVARAAADGYTLYLAYNLSFAATATLYTNLPYDPIKDFTPISMVADAPFVLGVTKSLAAHDLGQFLVLARAEGLNFASTGAGAGPHLATEMFLRKVGIKAAHVPFRGTNDVLTALLGGHVHFSFLDASAVGPLRSGDIRPLVVTSATRWPQLPDVPTATEALGSEFSITSGSCIMAPAGLPAQRVAELNAAITGELKDPAVIQRFGDLGFVAGGSTPEELGGKIRSDIKRLGELIRELGLGAR